MGFFMNYNNTGCFDHHHHSLTTKPLSCVILCEATVCPVFRGKRRNTTHRFNTGGPSSPKIQNMRRNNNTHTLCTWNMYLPKLEWFKGQCKHMYIHLYILYIYIPVPNVVWEAHACALRSVRGPHGTVSLSVCFRSLHGRFFFGMVEKNNLSGQGLSFYAHDPPQDKHTPQVPAPFARGNCRIPRAFLPG